MESVQEEQNQSELKKDYEVHIEKLRNIFGNIFKDTCKLQSSVEDFKKQHIPIARIKKVMKTDEDVNVLL